MTLTNCQCVSLLSEFELDGLSNSNVQHTFVLLILSILSINFSIDIDSSGIEANISTHMQNMQYSSSIGTITNLHMIAV